MAAPLHKLYSISCPQHDCKNQMDISDWATKFRALSNPHRLQIFILIYKHCSDKSSHELGFFASDLGQYMPLTPPTLSHHLKELRVSGLIHIDRIGKYMICTTTDEANELFSPFLHTMGSAVTGHIADNGDPQHENGSRNV